MNYMYLEQVPPNKVLRLTKNGLDGLKQRLDMLTTNRHKIYKYVKGAVKEPQGADNLLTREKIRDLERDDNELYKILQVLKHATVVSHESSDPSSVDIGSTAILRNAKGETFEYTVVCALEVDIDKHKISDESPLGRLIMGKKINDTFDITNRKGDSTTYTISEIK